MACSSGCPTPGAHRTYGECLRSKNTGTAAGETTRATFGYQKSARWDAEMIEYGEARKAGIQPATTNLEDIRAARFISEATGVAYQAT